MEFFSQTYVALRGPQGQPQTASETIGRLSDRLSPATLLADRRAAVLALKGLSRDHKQDVGDRALAGLLDVLASDAEIDSDIGKAVLETLIVLCEVDPANKELGFKYTDIVLATEKTVHTLFTLLGDNSFYTRFSTIEYLAILLQNRRQVVQSYFLKAPAGTRNVIAILEDKREIIRNEALTMVQTLVAQSPDIQKVLTFEGAFEKLFNIVTQEGGIEGGVVSQGALTCVDALLRFNTSNQSYFKETQLPPALCSLLLYPYTLPLHEPAPQEFALQFWDDQKAVNAGLVVGILGMLIGTKGSASQEASGYIRCLVEIGLASNAPVRLKTQSLRLLPANMNFPLSEIVVTPYMPVPETNGEEWDRLEPASALDALVELALHGEYNGLDSAKRLKNGLELRAAASTVFENFVHSDEIRHAIIQAMLPVEASAPAPPVTPLLHALASPLDTSSVDLAQISSTHFACLLFAHLLRSSPRAKLSARLIKPGPLHPQQSASAGQFFVPADGASPLAATQAEPDDDEPPQTLLQILSENLSLVLLARSRPDASDGENREWDRVVVGYLSLLSQWLWEDPKSVRDFLDSGGLGTLVEPVNQISESDVLIPSLCAFLLGICYEFNREPGEITRSTIHQIINRLGIDNLVAQISRLREDDRFRAIGPDSIVQASPLVAKPGLPAPKQPSQEEVEIWFDWAFVDFWKSNYYTVQRALPTDPNQLSTSAGQNPETAMLVASLREVIRKQAEEIESLQKRLKEQSTQPNEVPQLQKQVTELTAQVSDSAERQKDLEKEQEDLLVLLDEVSAKRKRDKARLKEAGLEVSEDEADDDEDDDE
ncbi:hypothetical protein P691DRAFT_726661 [Macrolepiota fuliginosa MF-IS2]|uniref:General vesicular transport factor p115 n=1 Tax=Macrolepiota fuliginosa MF-IS2 TaxID=1400762 RepID=A0A9P5XH12_9AGAR|nr:hypothetical protein P691DRAFT_726661 [Macrolepiota fuliginosa MF-IS2]